MVQKKKMRPKKMEIGRAGSAFWYTDRMNSVPVSQRKARRRREGGEGGSER